jgi:iron complex outermembrane receptor protein
MPRLLHSLPKGPDFKALLGGNSMSGGKFGSLWRTHRAAGLGFASVLALCAASGGALAQDDAADAAEAADGESDTIIVSARRRNESLQDVPIAVSAFGAEQLSDIGAVDLTDVGDLAPNTTLETTRASNTTLSAFIRGVGQQDPVSGFEAGVGIYIDDVYLNRPQAALLDIYDIERIEVLRGPQGTLYGRNTIGGAVKYVTRRLSDEPEGSIRVTGGTYGQIDALGTFSLPIATDSGIGDLLIGGSVAYWHRDGFGDNHNLVELENYNKEILAGRLSVEWNPSDDVSFRILGDWTDDNSDPKQGHRLLPFPGYPVLDNVFDTASALNMPEQSVVAKGVSGVFEWKADENFTIKNILAYREDRTETPIDFDSLPIVDLDVPGVYDNNQFSEEFQVLFESGSLNGLLGFYYLDADALTQFDVLLAGVSLDPSIATAVFTSADVNTKTWSIFGDLTYDLTDTLSVSLGGRYTSDKRGMDLDRQIFLGGVSPTFGGPVRAPFLTQTDLVADAKFEDFSPRTSISWEPSSEHTFYASYAKGFKGGSFDPRCVASTAPDIDGDGTTGAAGDFDDQRAFCLFQPETINTYEIGWKNNLAGGRFRSSLAGFYSKYKDVQIPGSIGVDTNGDGTADTFAGVTTNAAKATIYGVEFEGNAVLFENMSGNGDALDWQFSLGYINAEFDEYFGRGSPPPDITDLAVFQNTPRWTAYNRLTYTTPTNLFGAGGTTSVFTSVAYKSLTRQFNFVTPLDQPQYALLDAGLVWKSPSGRLKLSVIGTNLADKRYVVAGYDFVTAFPAFGNSPLGVSGVLTTFYGNPRQVFGTVEVAF